MKMTNKALDNLKKAIRTIIRRNFQSGTPENIRKEIKKYITENFSDNVKSEITEPLRKEIEKEFEQEFIRDKTAQSQYLKDARGIIRSASLQSNKIKDDIAERIFDAIEEGIKGNLNWKEIAAESINKLSAPGVRLNTEIDTHKAAFDRLTRIKNLEESGWQFIEYAGPSGTIRPFCVDHVGRIYSIDEVKKMTNMFGQPALYYMGGYNCRHRWDPVEGNIIKQTEDGKIFGQDKFTESIIGQETKIAEFRLPQLGKNSTILMSSRVNDKGFKNADVFENGIKTEYKRITEKTVNLNNAIRNQLRAGKEQAGRIVIWVDKNEYDKENISKAVISAKYFDEKKKIKEIIFIDKNGKEIKL